MSSAGQIRLEADHTLAPYFSATIRRIATCITPAVPGPESLAKALKRLAGVLAPLSVAKMPLAEPPPRDSRFGSPLKLSRVHWVRPEVVVEVTYLTWTEDNLLRQVSYQGQRRD